VTVELVGIGFVVGSSFVQTVTESIAFALLALTLGLLIAAWGLVSKVRRRLAAGAVIGLAALVLLVGVPLVRLETCENPIDKVLSMRLPVVRS